MVEHPDIHPPSDGQPDVDKFAALADAPVTALGLSSSDADALEQALDVKTVRDLADNKHVRQAQAIVILANERTHGDLLPPPWDRRPGCELVGQRSLTVARPRVWPPPPLVVPPCQEVSPLTSWHPPRAPAEPWGWRPAPGRPTQRQQTPIRKSG
jgi:hypothetical protein